MIFFLCLFVQYSSNVTTRLWRWTNGHCLFDSIYKYLLGQQFTAVLFCCVYCNRVLSLCFQYGQVWDSICLKLELALSVPCSVWYHLSLKTCANYTSSISFFFFLPLIVVWTQRSITWRYFRLCINCGICSVLKPVLFSQLFLRWLCFCKIEKKTKRKKNIYWSVF